MNDVKMYIHMYKKIKNVRFFFFLTGRERKLRQREAIEVQVTCVILIVFLSPCTFYIRLNLMTLPPPALVVFPHVKNRTKHLDTLDFLFLC